MSVAEFVVASLTTLANFNKFNSRSYKAQLGQLGCNRTRAGNQMIPALAKLNGLPTLSQALIAYPQSFVGHLARINRSNLDTRFASY